VLSAILRSAAVVAVVVAAQFSLLLDPPQPASAAESNGGVRVMPLGDSITDGASVPGGYRVGLWNRLAAAGVRTDFVGSRANGPTSLGDRNHEGHPGYRIDEVDAGVVDWIRAANPGTILLHIGTNDIIQNRDLANAPARLSALIDKIRANAPLAERFVATLIPSADADREKKTTAYNSELRGVVARKGPLTHLVDEHSAVPPSALTDGTHPSAAGYDAMATAWHASLASVPSSLTPLTTPPTDATGLLSNPRSGRCLDVMYSSTADRAATTLWDCHGGDNQRWTRTASGELRGIGGKCLDVYGASTANGTRLIMFPCSGAANQRFVFRPDGTIVGLQSGRCLDLFQNGTGNGTVPQIWDCNGGANQVWSSR
jgi:lysophospholipase L1-like esterase